VEFSRQNAQRGALAVGKIAPAPTTGGGTPGLEWGVLYPGPDGYVLTALAAATQAEPSGGTSLPGVTWAPMGLPALGTASQLLGVNTGATALEYKTLTAGSNITLTAAAGSITVAAANQLTIGSAVNGGGASQLLFEDPSQNLGSSANLGYTGSALTVTSATISCPQGTHAERFGATAAAAGINSVAVGYGATAAGNQGTAIGSTANASTNSGAVAVGYGATASANVATAIGGSSTASGGEAIAIGYSATANGSFAIALGYQATAGANTLQIGSAPSCAINTSNICGGSGGTAIQLDGMSSTTTERHCGVIASTFNVNTDAVWTGNLSLYAGDYTSSNAGKRLGVQIQSNGSAALVGLFGATPIVQPTAAGTTTGYTAGTSTAVTIDGTSTGGTGSTAYTLGDIVLALKSLGIIKT
jgi:hypothetical protein